MNTSTATQAILERGKKYTPKEYPTIWYDYVTGLLILPDNTRKYISKAMPLGTLFSGIEKTMQRIDSEQKRVNIFLRAGALLKNKPSKQYFTSGDGWKQDNFKFDAIQGKYYRNGFRVYLYGTHKYFGEERNLSDIRAAYMELQSQLDSTFQYPNFKLYATPAATGRNLLRVSLPEGEQYPTLPDDILRVIYKNICYQSRIEHFSPKRQVLENGVYVIDGAWMYASCLYHLPTGPCIHDSRNEIETYFSKRYNRIAPKRPGFYYMTATVPRDWQHIGLLKEYSRNDDSRYPNEPGYTFTNWTTADELVFAISKGWQVTIHERYYFPEELKDPFANWIRKLIALREEASLGKAKTDALLKAAYRNIVLHTIGSFKQSYTEKDYTDIQDEQFRELERTCHMLKVYPRSKQGVMSCKVEASLPHDRQPFVRPEWAATVWGRSRAKLAEFALLLPYSDIVSLRTDSVWCASLPEGVQKKGAWNNPGEFVVKDYISGNWIWPIDSGKMRDYVISYNVKHNNPDELIDKDNFYNEDEEV